MSEEWKELKVRVVNYTGAFILMLVGLIVIVFFLCDSQVRIEEYNANIRMEQTKVFAGCILESIKEIKK